MCQVSDTGPHGPLILFKVDVKDSQLSSPEDVSEEELDNEPGEVIKQESESGETRGKEEQNIDDEAVNQEAGIEKDEKFELNQTESNSSKDNKERESVANEIVTLSDPSETEKVNIVEKSGEENGEEAEEVEGSEAEEVMFYGIQYLAKSYSDLIAFVKSA